MTDIALFLAHALAMETEAAARYDELADILEVHNNPKAAELFRQMAVFSARHAAEVRDHAAGHDLPHLAPWDLRWQEPEGPEVAPIERTHYLMTPYHCLALALHNERRGRDYYAGIAAAATDEAVRALAQDFAAEEARHVAELEQWLARVPPPESDWDQDTDPPVVAD